MKKSPNPPKQALPFTEDEKKLRAMTNWQNHQWLKAGADHSRIDEFLALERRG